MFAWPCLPADSSAGVVGANDAILYPLSSILYPLSSILKDQRHYILNGLFLSRATGELRPEYAREREDRAARGERILPRRAVGPPDHLRHGPARLRSGR